MDYKCCQQFNGSEQMLSPLTTEAQVVYLDFDGELTNYNGEILTVKNVEVMDSQLNQERIVNIVTKLNTLYADQNVIFVTEKPADTEYSTVYVGKTSAFDEYGDFSGLAETIDKGNLSSTDKAFVMLDKNSDDAAIISTISHETDHLLGTLDHGGDELNQYAKKVIEFKRIGIMSVIKLETTTMQRIFDEEYTLSVCAGLYTGDAQKDKIVYTTTIRPSNYSEGAYYGEGTFEINIPVAEFADKMDDEGSIYVFIYGKYGTGYYKNVYGQSFFIDKISDIIFDQEKNRTNGVINENEKKACFIAVAVNALDMLGKINTGDYEKLVKYYGHKASEDGGLISEVLMDGGLKNGTDFQIFGSADADSSTVENWLKKGYVVLLTYDNPGDIGHSVTIDSILSDGTVIYSDSDDGIRGRNAQISNGKFTRTDTDKTETYTISDYTVLYNAENWSIDTLLAKPHVNSEKSTNSLGNAKIGAGGKVNFGVGSTVSGQIDIYNGGALEANSPVSSNGSQINISLAYDEPGKKASIYNLNNFSDIDISIAVHNYQQRGEYLIATDAHGFDGDFSLEAISLCGAQSIRSAYTASANFETFAKISISVGQVCTNGNGIYELILDDQNNLILKVDYNIIDDVIPPASPVAEANVAAITNQNVTVIATFSEDSVTKEFSFDKKTWQNYTSGIVISQNGTVYFRAADEAGNYSDVAKYTVDNIDKTAPAKPTAKANITATTNKNVTVTASFSSDSTVNQYSLDNKTWKTYTSGIVMSKNGTVYFRAADEAGNYSDVVKYTVDNIDKTAPAKPTAKANITATTNKNVTVTASFSSDSTVKQYSLDNKTWKTYTSGIVMSKNGTVYFRAVDEAGNYSEITEFKVGNIDKAAPVKPVAKANSTADTVKNITVTASFSKDSSVKQYSTDKKTWKTYSKGIVMKNNGTVYFRGRDNAGNYSAVTSYTVKNIVTVPVAKANITAATNKTVTVTATFSKNSTLEQFSLDKKTWKTYTKGIVFKKNGSVYFRAADAALNYTAITSYTVNNIDTAKPKINKVTATVKGYSATLKISATDNTKVAKYVVTYGKISKTITSNSLKLNNLAVGKVAVSVVAYDAAGNKSAAKKINLTVKDSTPPSKVTTLYAPTVTNKYKGTFKWGAATDNSGKIAKYEIQVDNGKIYTSSKTSVSVSNLKVGNHTYRVRAIDKNKNIGAWSAVKSFTVKDMTAPATVSLSAKVSGNNATLTWKKPKDNVGVTKYVLKYGNKSVTLSGSATKYVIYGLNKGTYSYSMIAYDAAGNASKAKTGKITIKQPLAPARAAEALYAADFAAPEALFAPQTDILAYCNDLQSGAVIASTDDLTSAEQHKDKFMQLA